MEQKKVTERKWKLHLRNEKMYADYCKMLKEGWMKTCAYKELGEKYGIKTNANVYIIIRKMEKEHEKM